MNTLDNFSLSLSSFLKKLVINSLMFFTFFFLTNISRNLFILCMITIFLFVLTMINFSTASDFISLNTRFPSLNKIIILIKETLNKNNVLTTNIDFTAIFNKLNKTLGYILALIASFCYMSQYIKLVDKIIISICILPVTYIVLHLLDQVFRYDCSDLYDKLLKITDIHNVLKKEIDLMLKVTPHYYDAKVKIIKFFALFTNVKNVHLRRIISGLRSGIMKIYNSISIIDIIKNEKHVATVKDIVLLLNKIKAIHLSSEPVHKKIKLIISSIISTASENPMIGEILINGTPLGNIFKIISCVKGHLVKGVTMCKDIRDIVNADYSYETKKNLTIATIGNCAVKCASEHSIPLALHLGAGAGKSALISTLGPYSFPLNIAINKGTDFATEKVKACGKFISGKIENKMTSIIINDIPDNIPEDAKKTLLEYRDIPLLKYVGPCINDKTVEKVIVSEPVLKCSNTYPLLAKIKNFFKK